MGTVELNKRILEAGFPQTDQQIGDRIDTQLRCRRMRSLAEDGDRDRLFTLFDVVFDIVVVKEIRQFLGGIALAGNHRRTLTADDIAGCTALNIQNTCFLREIPC